MPPTDQTTDGGKAVRLRKPKSPAPDTGPTCGQCKHWASGAHGDGECYRNPPRVQIDEDGYMLVRPILEPSERACGEFKGAN